jgi:hypothetical protein
MPINIIDGRPLEMFVEGRSLKPEIHWLPSPTVERMLNSFIRIETGCARHFLGADNLRVMSSVR